MTWAPCCSDPTIVIEADGEEDVKKTMKTLNFPVMDDDGVPSSYVTRVLGAVSKWRVKMHSLMELQGEIEECPENLQKFFETI